MERILILLLFLGKSSSLQFSHGGVRHGIILPTEREKVVFLHIFSATSVGKLSNLCKDFPGKIWLRDL